MRRKIVVLASALLLIVLSGMVLAQSVTGQDSGEDEEREVSFVIEAEIGLALPRSIIYDNQNERMAVIDAYNRLMLVNAITYETQHLLYERGNYHDLAFSNDGQWLALAIDSRIELWNAQTGELAADLVDLGAAIRITGPLAFSRDDNLLQFSGVYPAPRSIRQFEGQTINIPWLWNLTAARNEGVSTFPRQLEAWQFFDYPNGFTIGPENRIVAALPSRLQVLDAYSLELLFEIPTARYEQDPLNVWFSLRDKKIYVRPVNQNTLLQVDTQAGVLVEIPLNTWLSQNDLEQIGGIELSQQARLIGAAGNRGELELLETLLGDDYDNYCIAEVCSDGNPHTVTLIDLIIPPAQSEDNVSALLFYYDEARNRGRFMNTRSSFYGVQQMTLSPDEQNLLVRQIFDGEEYVATYDMGSGDLLRRFIPATRGIGIYNRTRKNRVLAYAQNGSVIVSDFQRFDATNNTLLGEDLRYSRRFDRFFFTDDSAHVVTLSGTEWRLWDVETGEVKRREVITFNGSIIRTSPDGFRYLTRFDLNDGRTGVEVLDLNDNSRRSVIFDYVPGSSVSDIYPSADWESYLITYSVNTWGPYAPGNQVAMYTLHDDLKWFIAGDDIPPVNARQYGWVNENTVYISGEGYVGEIPARVYGLDYDASGLPECAVQAFPEQIDLWTDLWERLVYYVRADALGYLTELICADLPDTAEEVQQLLLPTHTPFPITATPIRIEGVPVCLTALYPDAAEQYAETWRQMIVGLNTEQIAETERLLCEGIGPIRNTPIDRQFQSYTMMIDAETGERSTGSFTLITPQERPVYPIYDEFERTEDRVLGTAILAPNEEIIASSSLPGELIIYRLIRPYQDLIDQITATAQTNLEAQNLIGGLPSPTPTFDVIGTAQPTLTVTPTLTPIPRPEDAVEQPQRGEVVELCPAAQLVDIGNPPENYRPSGRIVAQVSGNVLWGINPVSGRRAPDESIPQCSTDILCSFSPDKSWILAESPAEGTIWVMRPDGSDNRLLYDEEAEDEDRIAPYYPRPNVINWSGPNTLEFEVDIEVERQGINGQLPRYLYWRIEQRPFDWGRSDRYVAIQQDILGVFPDPHPWIPGAEINTIPATIISRQPGGPWLLVRTTYSRGVGPGYKYYLLNRETGDYWYFARVDESTDLITRWHPLGDRLYYHYPVRSHLELVNWYQINVEGLVNRYLGTYKDGTWSNDGRYVAYSTDRRTQQVAVYDTQSGLTRTYCIPETGARTYDGNFTWSPDSRYVALQAFLPEDENDAGVGQHTIILDIESGDMIDLTTGLRPIIMWSQDPGTYGGDE